MATIHKHEIESGYPVPSGKVLKVGKQGGKLMLWVLYNSEPETQRFLVYGTGQSPNSEAVHLGTVKMSSGLVWHVFAEPL